MTYAPPANHGALSPTPEGDAPAQEHRYESYHEWLEHNPLGPEFANLVSLPEDLTPALTTQTAARERQDLLMEAGEVDAVALARETARTVAPQNTLQEMMVDQLAQAHRLNMALMAKSEHFTKFITSWDQKARQQVSSIEAARLAGSAARLMDTFQRGVLALDRLQNGAKQTVVVKHMQNVQVGNGGQAVVAATVKARSSKGGGGRGK